MSQLRPTPPPGESCLDTPYSSTQKGGTLIAYGVERLGEHERLLADPDGYRPDRCPRCGHAVLHLHDYRPRILLALLDVPATKVIRHRCPSKACGATWQTLPLIIARCLHRTWSVVESVVLDGVRRRLGRVPGRTRRRWRSRFRSSALVARMALITSEEPRITDVIRATTLVPRRSQLLSAWGGGATEPCEESGGTLGKTAELSPRRARRC